VGTPCRACGNSIGGGILRLRQPIRFANRLAALRMTGVERQGLKPGFSSPCLYRSAEALRHLKSILRGASIENFIWSIVALSEHPGTRSKGPALVRRPSLAALPILWAARFLPGADEFQLGARLFTRHVWLSLHPVSTRPALFEGLLPWLVY
jgi:hypothetical protein